MSQTLFSSPRHSLLQHLPHLLPLLFLVLSLHLSQKQEVELENCTMPSCFAIRRDCFRGKEGRRKLTSGQFFLYSAVIIIVFLLPPRMLGRDFGLSVLSKTLLRSPL